MLVQSIFPSLFGESAALEANFYSGARVVKSPVNSNCVIIYAEKPVEWLMDYLQTKNFTATVVDQLKWLSNSNGSISVCNL